jgi:hypothetical protein
MKRPQLSTRPFHTLFARLQDTAITLGASALMTMSLFDTMPDRAQPHRPAIVRDMVLTDRFDPRELLPGGIVLTVPMSLDGGGIRSERSVEFGPN